MGETTELRRPLLSEGAYAVAVAACAIASIVAVGRFGDLSLGPTHLVIGLTALQALNCFASGWLQRRLRAQVWQLDGALLAAGLVLLEAPGTAVALAVGAFVGVLPEKMRPASTVIYISHLWLATLAIASAAHLLLDGSAGSWQHGLLVVVAVVAHATTLIALVNGRELLVERLPFVADFVRDLKFSGPRTPFIASLGYVAGIAATVSSPAALLAVPSMAAMVYVLAEHFRAERDRERAETLFRTAEAAHSSIEPEEVADAVAEAARSLLGADAAEVRKQAPSEGEVGVALDTSDGRWLIVTGTDDDPDGLLPAVAAIGASALENARLAEQLRYQAVHDALTGLSLIHI